jgi:hypothetical protein
MKDAIKGYNNAHKKLKKAERLLESKLEKVLKSNPDMTVDDLQGLAETLPKYSTTLRKLYEIILRKDDEEKLMRGKKKG